MTSYGVTTWTLPARGRMGIQWAAEAGYALVHFDADDVVGGVRVFESSAYAAGVRLGGISVVELERVGLKDLASAFACVDRTLEIARQLAVPFVYLPAFGEADLVEEVDSVAMCEILGHALAATVGTEIVIGTENVLPSDRLWQLFERIGDPRLRLLFDTQNPRLRGIDPTSLATQTSEFLGPFVHVKDGIDTLGDCRLGEGIARVGETLRTLLSLRYCGTFVVESDYRDGDLDAAATDQQFLNRLMAEADADQRMMLDD
jgi:sugar phosphate isomerase/epimerase